MYYFFVYRIEHIDKQIQAEPDKKALKFQKTKLLHQILNKLKPGEVKKLPPEVIDYLNKLRTQVERKKILAGLNEEEKKKFLENEKEERQKKRKEELEAKKLELKKQKELGLLEDEKTQIKVSILTFSGKKLTIIDFFTFLHVINKFPK